MVKVRVKILNPNAVLPKQGSQHAGGWDLVPTEIIQESPDLFICKYGFAMQPPFDYKITIVPRSSITKTNWFIQNSPCLGDPDYIGEYMTRFRCTPIGVIENHFNGKEEKNETYKLLYSDFPFKVGERIAQMYVEEIIPIGFEIVDQLTETTRGDGGFGSTGTAAITE